MTDRVSYSHGFTVPGPEQFTSFRFDVSFETELRAGETPEAAMDRARRFVHAEADRAAPATRPAAAPAAVTAVDDQPFDLDNQLHRRLAANVMDHLKIKPENQERKMIFVLKGKRVGDMRRLLEEDHAAYLAKVRGRA